MESEREIYVLYCIIVKIFRKRYERDRKICLCKNLFIVVIVVLVIIGIK